MSQASEIVKALIGVVDQATFDGINTTGAAQLMAITSAARTFVQTEEADDEDAVAIQEELDLDE